MKRIGNILIILAFCLTVSPIAFAEEQTADFYTYYTYIEENGAAVITDVSPDISGAVTIPAALGGYPVTRIGDEAFLYCDNITSVTVPEGIETIGKYAFYGCTGLEAAVLPDSVTTLGSGAFSNCTGLQTVQLSNRLDTIEEETFWGCSSLGEVVLPDDVIAVYSAAFENCTALRSLHIPAATTYFDSGALTGCTALSEIAVDADNPVYQMRDGILYSDGLSIVKCLPNKQGSVVLPDGVVYINGLAFEGCGRLTEIVLPDSVKRIDDRAFEDCGSLTTVYIGAGLTDLCEDVFAWCDRLTQIQIDEAAEFYCTIDGVLYRSDDGDPYSMAAWPEGKSGTYTLPADVADIGCMKRALLRGNRLERIEVESGSEAFQSIDGVLFNKDGSELICMPGKRAGEYTVPEETDYVTPPAFMYCAGLTKINLSNSTFSYDSDFPYIGISELFNGCSDLTAITVGPENEAYRSLDGVLYSKKGGELLRCPEGRTGSFTAAIGTKTVDDNAFTGCSGLTELIFPDGTETIWGLDLQECSGSVILSIPASVTEISFIDGQYDRMCIRGEAGSTAEAIANELGIAFADAIPPSVPDSGVSITALKTETDGGVSVNVVVQNLAAQEIETAGVTIAAYGAAGQLLALQKEGVQIAADGTVSATVFFPNGSLQDTYRAFLLKDLTTIQPLAVPDAAEIALPSAFPVVENGKGIRLRGVVLQNAAVTLSDGETWLDEAGQQAGWITVKIVDTFGSRDCPYQVGECYRFQTGDTGAEDTIGRGIEFFVNEAGVMTAAAISAESETAVTFPIERFTSFDLFYGYIGYLKQPTDRVETRLYLPDVYTILLNGAVFDGEPEALFSGILEADVPPEGTITVCDLDAASRYEVVIVDMPSAQ